MTGMLTASQIVHAASGAPVVGSCIDIGGGRCCVCAGSVNRGMPFDDWMKPTFVDQNRLRYPGGTDVCEACVWATAGRPPDTLRMYTFLVDDRGCLKLNKGDKAKMREWLFAPKQGPWVASIADSGQKHCVPFAPVNPPGAAGLVFFETGIVKVGSWVLIEMMCELLTAGATKAEIDRGDYSPRAWQLCEGTIRAFEVTYQSERGSSWFTLALWLAQRDEEVVQRRMAAEKEARKNARPSKQKAARGPDSRAATRAKKRVPEDRQRQHAEALGHSPVAGAQRVEDVREPGGVGDADRAQAPDTQAERGQLTLFGGAGK